MDVERSPTAVPRALTIAGSDSGGGAGIQADLKTFAVLGVWGMSAITSITVQNTKGVSGVSDIPPNVVADQVRAVVTDIGVDAAKTGMLSSTEIIEAVGDVVAEVGVANLVVDPVFVSKHGDSLLRTDAVDALRRRILPLATVVTPNLPEASGLAGFDVKTKEDMETAARAIHGLGPRAVLVKGGHLEETESDDLFFDGHTTEWLSAERVDTPNTHGTGCVLASAITSYLARHESLVESVRKGKEFVTQAIRHSLAIGGGIGPVSPGWRLLAPPEEQVGPGGREEGPLR
ncbi:MAG: bifunctional hydroxymethylpyrimidine kinase/phosphomethylpyrimidine kinase [Actinomycetota bacterium]|nr:bifunctional hydroxymethylpyrimidine kinase/phosphomethylpyrimidine kinase [Actinomycetota bacterium]